MSPSIIAPIARPNPVRPCRQIATKAAAASSTASAAKTSAAPKVTSDGSTSSRSVRTTMIESTATTSPNTAKRPDQMASRDIGSSRMTRRIPYPEQIRFSAAQSPASRKGSRRPRTGDLLDRRDARLGFRMVEQDLHARLGGAADLAEDDGERARVAARLVHQARAIVVGRGFHAARIGRAQYGLGSDHHRAAADEIAEQHAEHQRQPARLQHRAGAVVMGHMADLVREHAGDLVGTVGLGDQPLEHVDAPARQRDGVGFFPAHHHGGERHLERGRMAELGEQPLQRGGAGFFARGMAAFEGGARVLGVEHAAHLHVDGVAQPAFQRHRHQRRQPIGERRHAEIGDQHQRQRRGHGPADHAYALPALALAGAVDIERTRIDHRGHAGIEDFKPLQHLVAAAAEAQHLVGCRQAFDLVVWPSRQDFAVAIGDPQAVGRQRHHRVMARAGLAIEIDGAARNRRWRSLGHQ